MKKLFIEPLMDVPPAVVRHVPEEVGTEWIVGFVAPAALAAQLTPEDREVAAALRPESRRREVLTWRAIVRRELGRDAVIGYTGIGAPALRPTGPKGADPKNTTPHPSANPESANLPSTAPYLSVAHCAGRVAVCISDGPCGVDIEPETRDFSRAVARYMTPDERALSAHPLWPAVVWCAKEALYKYSGRQGLGLLRDLRIAAGSLDFAAGSPTFIAAGSLDFVAGSPGLDEAAVRTASASDSPAPAEIPTRLAGSICGGKPVGIDILRREGYIIACIL